MTSADNKLKESIERYTRLNAAARTELAEDISTILFMELCMPVNLHQQAYSKVCELMEQALRELP